MNQASRGKVTRSNHNHGICPANDTHTSNTTATTIPKNSFVQSGQKVLSRHRKFLRPIASSSVTVARRSLVQALQVISRSCPSQPVSDSKAQEETVSFF